MGCAPAKRVSVAPLIVTLKSKQSDQQKHVVSENKKQKHMVSQTINRNTWSATPRKLKGESYFLFEIRYSSIALNSGGTCWVVADLEAAATLRQEVIN